MPSVEQQTDSTTCRDCDSPKIERSAWCRAHHNAERRRRWREQHPESREHHRAVQRRYRANRDRETRDRGNAYLRRWRRDHPASVLNSHARRRISPGAQYVPVTEAQLAGKLAHWGGCWICGGPADSWDHVKPLALGGPHLLANLRPACRLDNYARSLAPGLGWPLVGAVRSTSRTPRHGGHRPGLAEL